MASLVQQPTEWNLAYMPNVWVVTSGTGTAALQVEINGVVAATIQQIENPVGACIFDVAKILQSYLEPNFIEETQKVAPAATEVLQYRVRYGDVSAVTGLPIWTAYSSYKLVLNGYENWRELNWPYAAFQPVIAEGECESANPFGMPSQAKWLTNWPTAYNTSALAEWDTNFIDWNIETDIWNAAFGPNGLSTTARQWTVRSNEYQTLSFFNKTSNSTLAVWDEQPYFVTIEYYNASGTLLAAYIYSIDEINGLGPRTDCNDLGAYTYAVSEHIGHVGVGPQNLKDAGLWFNSSAVAYYDVKLRNLDACTYFDNGPISDCEDIGELFDFDGEAMYEARFTVVDACTIFEPIRLSFLNQYGVKDYFTFDRRNTYNVDTQRNNYQQVLGTWNASTFSIPQQGRGQRTFSSAIKERMTLTSNWMPDEISVWLQELYTSPHVLIYKDGKWEPCVITTTTYEERTNARNRMFQHTIEVEYSNNKNVQRG